MNDYQRATLASYDLTVKVSNLSEPSMTLIPKFKKGILRLMEIILEIKSNSTEQSTNITGVTQDEATRLNLLIRQLLEVSGAVHSYAVDKGDRTLQEKVNYKEWTVERMPQSEVITAAEIVLQEALKISPQDMEEEGITSEDMLAFSDNLTLFKDTNTDNQVAIGSRRVNTKTIAELFTEAHDLKKNTLDRLAIQFQRKDPEFYIKYKHATRVINRQGTTTPEPTPPAAV